MTAIDDEFVSIVIPTRDRADLIGGAVESVLSQSADRRTFECVVVDNHSSDDTAAIVRRFEDRFPGVVHYVRERRIGVSWARNAGIATSRGTIVGFVDDDVRVDREWLGNARRLLQADRRLQYVGGPVRPIWTTEPPAWLTREHWSPLALVDHGDAAFDVPDDHPICLLTANLFVRRAALDRAGWFDPAFPRCQDRELMLRLWKAGLHGLYSPEVAAQTVVPPERVTREYHRRWHWTHGESVARMPLREAWVNGGWAVEPAQGGSFLGAPWSQYRALWDRAAQWTRSSLAGQGDEAFGDELQARYSLAYIWSSMKLWRGGSWRLGQDRRDPAGNALISRSPSRR